MLDLLNQLFPEPVVIAVITPITTIAIFLFLYISGKLKISYRIKANYTRKLFHILVFSVAGIFGLLFDHRVVMFYGGLTGLVMIFTLYLGEGNILYEGIARKQDAPHRSFYIGVPFISTAIGGLVNNYTFGSLAIVGYLVAGWGDAVGEPIGARFGKHKYYVLTLRRVKCERSIEGSVAVLSISSIAVFLGLWLNGISSINLLLIIALTAGSVTAIIEAITPHGLDNFTTQVGAVSVCYFLLWL